MDSLDYVLQLKSRKQDNLAYQAAVEFERIVDMQRVEIEQYRSFIYAVATRCPDKVWRTCAVDQLPKDLQPTKDTNRYVIRDGGDGIWFTIEDTKRGRIVGRGDCRETLQQRCDELNAESEQDNKFYPSGRCRAHRQGW